MEIVEKFLIALEKEITYYVKDRKLFYIGPILHCVHELVILTPYNVKKLQLT